MNRTHRTLWNDVTQAFVAVGEHVRARGKSGSSSTALAPEAPLAQDATGPMGDPGQPTAPRAAGAPWRKALSSAMPRMYALESRLMFDAAAAADAVQDATAHTDTHLATLVPAARETTAAAPQPAIAPPERDTAKDTTRDLAPATRVEVVFIDAQVAGWQQLALGVSPHATVVVLPSDRDGLTHMADYLAEHPGVDAIHIVSHGWQGDLWLGNHYLSTATLGADAATLARIGQALGAEGDILLYACDTGAGETGTTFVGQLAALTGADVAASDDRTGAGGDWQLEVTSGTLETSTAFSAATMAAYDHSLATITVTTNADSGAGSLRNAISSATAGDTITFDSSRTVTLSSGQLTIAKNLTIDGDLDNNGTADVTIDAAYTSRIFNVTSGTVTLDGLTLTRGMASGAGGDDGQAGGSGLGGAISNIATLTLNNTTVAQNAATGGGGGGGMSAGYVGGGGGGGSGANGVGGASGGTATNGFYTYPGLPGSSGSGGNGGSYDGIRFGGRGGSASGGGAGGSSPGGGYSTGGAGATATIGGITIGGGGGGSGWDATGGAGGDAAGAIYNTGTLNITGTSVISNNLAAGGGGGGAGGSGNHGGLGGRGVGALWNTGTVNITSANLAAISGNVANSGSIGPVDSGNLGASNSGYSSPTAVAAIYNVGTLNTISASPTVTSATYDASTGVLTVTGTGMTSGDTIDASKLTLTGQGGSTYTLTSGNVTAASATAFSVTLNATDKLSINGLLNQNGTSSVGATTFNLAAAANWDSTASASADLTGNGITTSNVTAPAITSATYNASTHVLTVTGTNLVAVAGATNDITTSRLTLTGQGGGTYTLTSANVEVTSATSFSITLNSTDQTGVDALINQSGTSSLGGTTYNLAAADDWNSVVTGGNIADLTGNGITASNVLTPPIFSSAATSTTGAKVILTYDSTLSATTAAAGAFTVTVDGTARSVTAAVVSGSTVELTLGLAVDSGETVTVAYADPSGANDANAVQDSSGNDAASLSATGVTNQAASQYYATFDHIYTANNPNGNTFNTFSEVVSTDGRGIRVYPVNPGLAGYDPAVTFVSNGSSNTVYLVINGTVTQMYLTNGVEKTGGSSTPEDAWVIANNTNLNAATLRYVLSSSSYAINTGGNETINSSISLSDLDGLVTYQAAAVVATPPTATLVVADATLTAGETSAVTITFSEAVTGFTNADLTVANGTLGVVSSSDGGITWTATFTPSSSVTDTTNLITLDNTGVVTVSSSTAGSGSTDSNNYAIDTARPTATLVVADNTLLAGETSGVTITFSEAVTGFTNADLTVANGTLSAVSSIDGGITWTATFTPTANITDATNLITLDNTGVSDAVGNAGSGSTDSNNYAIDTAVAPVVTSVQVPTNATYVAGQTLEFVVNFDAIVFLSTGDCYVPVTLDTGGTVNAQYVSGSGSTSLRFQYTVTNGNLDTTGITLGSAIVANGDTLESAVAESAVLTLNSVAATSSVLVDAVVPAVSAPTLAAASDTGTSSSDSRTRDTTPTLTGTAEANATVTLYDTDGTTVLGVATADGSGNWSITSATLTEGAHTLTAKATDAAGNVSLASPGLSVTIDITSPTLTGPSGTAGDATATDSVVENTTAVHTFTANETVTWAVSGGVDAAKFSINASTGALVFATAPDFEAPTDADSNNAYVVQVQATDSAGNVSTQTVTITVTDVADNTPVLADTTLTHTVLEDAAAPVGAVGSLISAYTGGITDGDAGAASGIAITAADTSLGTWYYTTDGGSTWQAVGTVSTTSARVLANDANTRLYFQPTADTSGNVSAGLTFKAWDQSDGLANGSSGVDTVGGISLLGTLGTAGQAYDVKLSPDGTRAYVSGIGNGLSIIDISDRSAPTLLGTYTGAAGAHFVTLAADGNTAYIGENGAIQIVDVSDPANPTLLSSLGGSGSFYEIALSADGNTAYVASDYQGLQVVDVSNPASPTLLGAYNTSGQAVFVILSADGQTAYVGDIGGDLQIIDVSTSASPSLLGTVTGIHAYGGTLSSDGQTAYVADSSYGLRVIDVSNPASTTLLGSLAVPGAPGFDVALSADGNTAYITGSTGNLTLVDVSSPSAPVQLASYNTAGLPIGVALSSDGSVAYVANVYLGLQVIDVNLSAPGAFSTATDTIALTVTPVNDAPALSGDLVASLNQGATYTLTTADLGYTDVDDVDAGETFSVGTLVNGTVQVSGVSASSFTAADLTGGLVTFVHDGTATPSATFAVTVEDGNEDASTPAPSTFTFTVDVAASITGPAGSAGDGVSQVTLLENGTAVHTFVASEAVTWSLSTLYADDAARFTIDASTGALSFIAAPDYEAPGDTDSNQQYVVRVQATDAAGNVSTQEVTITIVDADEVAPTVTGITSSTANGIYKAGDTLSLQVHFDEAVTVTGTPQLALETGATDRVVDYVSGSGTDTLTFLYTVQAGDTSADLDQLAATALALNGGTLRDAAGNHAVRTLASPGAAGSLGDNQALVIDTTAPAAPSAPDLASASDTGVSDTDNRTRDTTPTFTGTAEAGATVTLYDTDGTTVLGTGTADGSGHWSITTSPLSEGGHTVSAKATDAAGNVSIASASLLVTVDTLAPTATVVVADAMLTSSETSAVTITFSEAVSGFTTDDLLVENGALSGLSTVDGGTTWTATLTPTAGIADATNLITLDNTGVSDLAGNAGSSTTDSNPYAIDTLNPSLATSIMVSDAALRRGDSATVTFVFTEAISGFTTADVTVSNGTLSGLNTMDGGITWVATLTPYDGVTDFTNLITLDYTGVLDAAGNAGSGAATSGNYAIDTATPTATVVVADATLTAGETSAVTFTFSEAVSGFTLADLLVDSGTLTGLTTVDGGTTWTATLTPTAGITDATNLITLDNTGVSDLAGNAGSATTESNLYAIDTAAPIITGPSGQAGGATATDSVVENTTAVHTFSADQAVTWTLGGTDTARFNLDATTGALRFIAAPDFEAPNDADANNTYVVQVQATDAAGNISTQTLTVTVTDVDEVAPAISGPSGSAGASTSLDAVAENTTAVHTFSASEAVTWAIGGGADAAKFSIDASTGALRFITAPDFEAPNDSNRDNTYVVQVQATDAAGHAATQQVTVRVTDANEAPALSGDLAATVAEGGSVTLSAADLGFVDVDDGAAGVTFRITALRQGVVQVGGATATAFSGTDLAAGRVSFRHDGTEGAAASFSVSVDDGNEDSSTPIARTFTLAVTPVNDAPVTAADTATTAEDTSVTIDVLANDRDAEGDALSLVSASVDPSEGTVAVVNGRLVFTPAAHFTGTATITYVMTDGTAALPPAQVTVTVTPVNDVPVWLDGSSADLAAEATMDAGTELSGQAPGARDADGDALAYTLAEAPANGTLVISADGAWTYKPAASFSGVDTMTVVVSDGQGGVRRLTLSVTVRPLPVVAPEVSPPAPAPVTLTEVVELPSAPQALQATPFDSVLSVHDAGPAAQPTIQNSTPVPDASRFTMPTERADGDIYTRSSGFQVMVTPANEPNLRLYRGVDDVMVSASAPIQIQVPADTFMHTVLQETVTLSAVQANGQPLPRWLSFDGKSGQFVGTPPAGLAGDLAIRIVARDSQGREAVATFRIQLNRSLDRPTSLNGGHRGLGAQLSRGEAWTIQPGQRVWQAQPRPVAAPRG
jgi:hypothetical protein